MAKSRRKKIKKTKPTKKIVKASPFSTGGGGSVFEQLVGTLYLTSLLLKSPPHGHESGEAREVRFQRRFVDGEPLDDLITLLDVPAAPFGTAKLSLQLKHDMDWGLGETNTIYREVMRACWQTFNAPEFNFEFDRFGVVLGVEKSSYRSYRKVLDHALYSASSQDFVQKIKAESIACTTFLDLIRATLGILAQEDGEPDKITNERLWKFLRSLVLLRFDLMEAQSKDRYDAVERTRTLLSFNKSSQADDLWDKLFGLTSKGIPLAGGYTRPDLIQKLRLKGVAFLSSPPQQIGDESGTDDASVRLASQQALESGTASTGGAGTHEPDGPRKLPDDETQRLVSDARLDAQIDAARTFIEEGKVKAARTLLEQARRSCDFPLSPSVQFRIAANLGFCAFEMDDVALAIVEFRAAYRSLPHNYKAKIVGAQGAFFENKFQEAINLCEEVLKQEPRYQNAVLFYVQALAKYGDFQKLDEFVSSEPWIEDDPSCALALAEIRSQQNRWEETIQLLEDAHIRDPNNAGICSQLGFHLIQRARRDIADNPPLLWRTPSSVINDFERAAELLTKSIEVFEHYDNRRHLLNDAGNRAAAYGLLDRYEEALRDCDRVLSERPDDQIALLNKGWTLLKQGNDLGAIWALSKVTDDRWKIEAVRSLVLAHLRLEQWQAALDVIDPHLKPASDSSEQIELADYRIHALDALGRRSEARKQLDELTQRYRDEPEILVIVAHQQIRENSQREAILTLRRAVRLSSGRQKDRVTLSLAEALFHVRRYATAARVYRQIVDECRPGFILKHFVMALMNTRSGQAEALKIARNIRQNGKAVVFYSEVEADLAEDVGDLTMAIQLRRELATLEPNRTIHRLRLALMEFHSGNVAVARQELDGIERSDLQGEPYLMMEVARARADLGLSGALELGYEARRLALTDAQIQVEYIGLFQMCAKADDPLLSPVQSRPDCALHIEVEGEVTKWLLVEGVATAPYEISLQDSRAREFIGRRVGDLVAIKKNGLMGNVTGRIIQVQHRFVYAYQDVSEKLKTGQIVHPTFDAQQIVDVQEFLEQQAEHFKERRRIGEQAATMYRRFDLPLSAFAAAQNQSVIELWREIGEVGGRFIVSDDGIPDVLQRAEALRTTQKLVLDATAICTITLLELEEVITRRYAKLIVPHAVWQELNQYYISETINQGRAGILWHNGFRFYYRQISEEENEAKRHFLKRALHFVQHATEIQPAYNLVKEPISRRQGIGKSTLSAILLAQETGEVLYSDDLRVRNLAHTGYNVRSTYIWPIMSNLQPSHLSLDDLCTALCRLVLHGYTYLVMTHQVILHFMKSHEMRMDNEVRVLLHRVLSGEEASVEWATRLAHNLIVEVWKEKLLVHKFQKILSAVLDALVSKRSSAPTLQALRARLQAAFFYDPVSYQQVWNDVERWACGELQQIDIGSQLEVGHLQVAPLDATLELAHPRRRL
jgi:tetratricopeptide (TPR) repeat protein